tara:strand:- start:5679 stop:5903 length:225 start_codon:yes stop_codon:yes gene_type:complete
MRQKITNLSFTLVALTMTTYAAYTIGLNSEKVEIVEVEEYGLNNYDNDEANLQQLIKTYEVDYPEEVPWKTCVQ